MTQTRTRRWAGHGEYDPNKISGLRFLKKMHGAQKASQEQINTLRSKNFGIQKVGKVADDPELLKELK